MSKLRLRNFSGMHFKTEDLSLTHHRKLSEGVSSRFNTQIGYDNHSRELQTTNDRSLLFLLSQRRSSSSTITNEIISKVVNNLILPMFKHELNPGRPEKKRHEYLQKTMKSRPLNPADGTAFSKLTLCDQLLTKNRELQISMQKAEQHSNDMLCEKIIIDKEIKFLKDSLMNAEAMIMSFQTLRSLDPCNLIIESAFKNQSNLNYKELFKEYEKKVDQLSLLLQEEKALNDIRLK